MTTERLARLPLPAWPVVEQLASPIAQLVLTPLLLHRLGAEQFGLWVLALTPLLAAATLSLGRSVSLLAVVPRWCAQSQQAAVRPLVLRVLGLVAATSLSLLCILLATQHWIVVLLPTSLERPLLYLLLVLALVIATEVENTVTYTLKGLGEFKTAALAELVGRTAQTIGTVAIIGTGSAVTAVVTIAVAVALLKITHKSVVLLRRLPRGPARTPAVFPELHLELMHTGFWNWIQVLCGLIFYSFDRWVVGFFLGPAALGAYAVCSQLAQLSHALAAAAAQPLVPWAAAQAGSLGSPAVARAVGRVALAASLAACVLPAIVIAAAPMLLSAWISPVFADRYAGLTSGLGVVFLLLAANVPSFNLLIGWGQTRYAAMLTVAAASWFVLACLIVQPEQLATIVFYKLGYAAIGFVSVLQVLACLRRARHATV